MRRSSRIIPALLTSIALLLTACGDDDGTTGDADPEADTQIEGDRDTAECTEGDDLATGETLEPTGEDPQGAVEDQDACTSGNEGDSHDGGDGETNPGGPPGVGTP
jgi:hypothetical protein